MLINFQLIWKCIQDKNITKMMNNLKHSVQKIIKIQLKLIKKIIMYKQKRKIKIIYNQLINKKVKI